MARYKRTGIRKIAYRIKKKSDRFWDKIEKKLSRWIFEMDNFMEEHDKFMEHEGEATPQFIRQLKKELNFLKVLWILNMICVVCLMITWLIGR